MGARVAASLVIVGLLVATLVVAQVMNMLNATGGSFPRALYPQTAFFYQFVDPTTSLTYYGPDSTAGKCNMMGYWSSYNANQVLNGQQVPVPSSWMSTAVGSQFKYTGSAASASVSYLQIETNMCTDACTGNALFTASTTQPTVVGTATNPAVSVNSGATQCPYDSCVAPRQDAKSRHPLADIGASDALKK